MKVALRSTTIAAFATLLIMLLTFIKWRGTADVVLTPGYLGHFLLEQILIELTEEPYLQLHDTRLAIAVLFYFVTTFLLLITVQVTISGIKSSYKLS